MSENTKKTATKRKPGRPKAKPVELPGNSPFSPELVPMKGDTKDKPATVSMDVVRAAFEQCTKRESQRGRGFAVDVLKTALRFIENAAKE